jgi:hypothetical protein
MRINELLVESQQLDEGPFGQAVAKGVGGLAKGVGAVAGGIAGIPGAVKKGFKAGKSAVQGDPAADTTQTAPTQTAPAAAASTQAAPVKKPGLLQKIGKAAGEFKQGYQQGQSDIAEPATTATDINAQGPKGTAAAKTQSGAAAQAIQKTAQATQGASAEKVGQTVYAQVKSQINQLDKKGKQRILQLLQKSITTPPATPAAAAPVTTPAPAAPGSDAAKDELYGAGNRPKGAKDKVAALKSQNKKKAAPTQAEIDADRARLMGNFNDSIERHKQSMVAEGLSNGSIKIFKQ